MNNIITNSLEKYSLKNSKLSGWKLCQKNENGNELIFTENSSVYHAVCGYKGEFAQAVWNFIQSDFSWQQARDLIGWERHLVRIAMIFIDNCSRDNHSIRQTKNKNWNGGRWAFNVEQEK